MRYIKVIIAAMIVSMLLLVACAKQEAAPQPAPAPTPAPAASPSPAEQPAPEAAEEASAAEAAPTPAGKSVTIEGFAFSPSTVTVKKGETVTWTNKDSAPHTASADDGSWDTGRMDQGDSGSVTFDKAGTFTYHCGFHASMEATVVVEGAEEASAPAATPPKSTY